MYSYDLQDLERTRGATHRCMWTEGVIPDNKAVLRDALSSLDIRGRKAPATDEVCLTVSSQQPSRHHQTPACCAQDHVTHAFWDTQPVPAMSESTEDVDDSEMGTAAL